MRTLPGVLLISVWAGAALASRPFPSAPPSPEDVSSVKQAIAGAKPDCRIESIDGFGLGETATSATIRCEPIIDQSERRISSELTCERDVAAWTCKLQGTRVRYGGGTNSVDLILDLGITVNDGIRAFETCLLQQEFRAHYIERSELGFVAYAQEGMIVDADVVLGDKPSCLRRDHVFSPRPSSALQPPESSITPRAGHASCQPSGG